MSLTLTCTVGCRGHRASFPRVLCHGVSLVSISRVRAWVIQILGELAPNSKKIQSYRDQFAIQSSITVSSITDSPLFSLFKNDIMLTNSGAQQQPAQPVYVLRGHSAQIHSLLFVRENERLVTADADGWVVLWKVATRRPVSVWKAHEGAVMRVAEWRGRILTCVLSSPWRRDRTGGLVGFN